MIKLTASRRLETITRILSEIIDGNTRSVAELVDHFGAHTFNPEERLRLTVIINTVKGNSKIESISLGKLGNTVYELLYK